MEVILTQMLLGVQLSHNTTHISCIYSPSEIWEVLSVLIPLQLYWVDYLFWQTHEIHDSTE